VKRSQTSGQTTFNTGGYTAGYIDVYLNGVKLAAADYTATNGSDVVLAVGAAADDILETVAYSAFTVADQDFTGETTAEDLTVTGAFTSQGIDDNATSTAMTLDGSGNLLVGKTSDTFSTAGAAYRANGSIAATASANEVLDLNRLSTDGNIMRFFKDGSSVGSIGTDGNYMSIGNGAAALVFQGANNRILPWNQSTNNVTDASLDLGNGSYRFRDAYLSGGVYLGGVGSPNKLDDYEEGTWTATAQGTSFITNTTGHYTKVGNTVFFYWYSGAMTMSSAALTIIGGLPFTAAAGATNYSAILATHNDYAPNSNGGYVTVGTTSIDLIVTNSINRDTTPSSGTKYVMISGHYRTA